jgi:type IV pilus assembly protein PilN
MIRINLLSEGRKPVAAKKPKFAGFSGLSLGELDLGSVLLVSLLIVGLLVAAGHNFVLKGKLQEMNDEVAEAKAEVDRLAPIIKEVEEFKIKKAELEHKVEVINNLRANQHGPVLYMDKISRAIPELLWLRQMKVQGNSIALNGEAFNVNAIASFVENLDKVPEFTEEPVTRDITRAGTIYRFVVNFTFTYSLPETSEGETAQPSERES